MVGITKSDVSHESMEHAPPHTPHHPIQDAHFEPGGEHNMEFDHDAILGKFFSLLGIRTYSYDEFNLNLLFEDGT